MTVKTVKGVVRGGKVEMSEKIEVADGTEVMVNVPVQEKSNGQMITFGMFAGPRETTEEDFKLAQWSGEDEASDA